MKQAEVEDVWRRLRAQESRQLMGLTVHWSGISKLSDGGIVFSHPFSLICGENGVGKSTILHRVMHSLVCEERRLEGAVYSKEEEGTVDILRVELGHSRGLAPQTLFQAGAIQGYFSPEGEALRAVLFDPAMHVPALLNAIRRDANFSEVIEPLLPKVYSEGEVEDVAYLVGRDYERVLAFEVESVGDLGVFPYFLVTVAGIEYGSESMGFGELSLLLGYWLLSRMPKGSLVLLEEPETFVSPRSQRRFTDMAARFALANQLKVIATTHSPAVVSRFRDAEMTLVSRNGHNVTLHSPPPRSALERRLELVNPNHQVWFVEDALAARVAGFFANELGVERDVDIFVAGNNDAVLAMATTSKPSGDSRVSFVGLLDGDERLRRATIPLNVGFLPTGLTPDSMVLGSIRTAPRLSMAGYLGVDENTLELGLASCAGQEHHQALHTLREELKIGLDQLVAGGLRGWLMANEDEAATFMTYLTDLMASSRGRSP